MGSIFQPKAPPPPPPPPPPATIRDEIGGTEQVPVRSADGSVTYITRRLPLSPEQEAQRAEFKKIMEDSLAEIQRLSSADFQQSEAIQGVLKAWEAQRKEVLSEAFTGREESEEAALARRGLGDSSAGQAVRRQRRLDRQDALSQLQRERELLGSDIRSQQLAQQQNLFNLAASRQDLDTVRAQRSATAGINAFSAVDAANRASIADYYNRRTSRLQSTSQPSVFQFDGLGGTIGGTVGTAFGGPVGGAVGSVVGSTLGSLF